MNIVSELRTQLKGCPCQVYANDMKVLIRSANVGKYPDLVAHCGEPELLDGHRDVLLNPGLIVEVLSASTETYDREGRFALSPAPEPAGVSAGLSGSGPGGALPAWQG